MAQEDFQKWFTGHRMKTSTVGAATPPINSNVPDREANFSTATVTARTAMTIGGETYNAGDIMAFSDGHYIYNRNANVMGGSPNSGSIKSIPQAISIVPVPDFLAQNVGGTDYRGKLFWVFANGHHNGIRVGVIDMTQNSGLGEFKNYSQSAQTPSGGVLGTLKDSERGVGGRMAVICRRGMKGSDSQEEGYWVIAKQASKAIDTWTDSGWHVWPITTLNTSTLFPNIDTGPALSPIVSAVGTSYTGWGDSGPHGIVDFTPIEVDPGSVADHKLATIYRATVGTPTLTQENDVVEVLTFNGTTGVISNPTTKITKGYDKGPLGWPAPISTPARYYNMYVCWSHDSTATTGYLYYGNYNVPAAAPGIPGLQILWNEINNLNVWSLTNLGAIEVEDNSGNNIWNDIGPGRIIGGIWRDPQKMGRIFVSTPEQTDQYTLAVSSTSPVWSMSYPEIYGTATVGLANPIQHCIIEDAHDPVTTQPILSMVGTLDNATYYKYGAPQFTVCAETTTPPSPDISIKKCVGRQYVLDTEATLYVLDTASPASTVNQVTTFGGLTNLVGMSINQYTDQHFIWSSPTGGNSISYSKFNSDTSLVANPVAIGGGNLATYADIPVMASSTGWVNAAGSGTSNAASLCKTQEGLGLKAGSTTLYSYVEIDTDANTINTYNAAAQIDISSAFGGALAGKTPTAAVVYKDHSTASIKQLWVAFGDRIAYLNRLTNSWTLVTATAPANITALQITNSGATPTIWVYSGAAGSTISHSGVPSAGAGFTFTAWATSVITDPGGFPWLKLPISIGGQNANQYFDHSPLRITSTHPDYLTYEATCDDALNDVWKQPVNGEHRGCFECGGEITNWKHDVTCDWLLPDQTFSQCRFCVEDLFDECVALYPCCNILTDPPLTSGMGPVELPGIVTNTGSVTVGNTYSASAGGATPVCSVAVTPENHFWFTSEDGNIYSIDSTILGTCSISAFSVQGGLVPDLKDVTFDKHGNVIYTSGISDISWASALSVSYISAGQLISNTFNVPQCLDYDYSATGHIVGADMVAAVATFTRYTNSLGAGLAIATTVTNATISLGYDLTVDYNSGDYFVLGDETGGGGLNKLISIDDANGNHTLVSDLATVCSFVTGQNAYGIERIRTTQSTSAMYVLSAIQIGLGPIEIYLHELTDDGSTQVSVTPLINPATATNSWTNIPTGIGYNDVCSKWPNNVDPNLTNYTDCNTCLSDPSTEDCCYKLTNCDTGAVQYSTQGLLDPYVGNVIRLTGDTCWEVERSLYCNSPVTVIPAASPGPYADCAACDVPDPIYYKLPKCGDASDVVYTVNGATAVSTPGIDGYFAAGVVVQLTGECFCREVQLNPSGPQGTEANLSVSSTQVDCANCIYYLRVEDCVTGAIIDVDYASSTTLHPFIGAANAHDITIGGVAQDNCFKVLVGCIGPTTVTYPTAAITASYADCAACATAGQTCVKVSHCCGTSYVPDQIVNVTTGITAADVGAVVQADITVAGIIYTGCWTVSANGDCVGVLPDADVNAINTSTVGTGNMPDCTYCLIDPCPLECTLLESCTDPGVTITVSGGLGNTIGTDVVELSGQVGCWKQCLTSGNPIAGTNWFYGERLGIDFSSGAPVSDMSGMSDMLTYNASNALAGDAYTFRGSAVHSATEAATLGGHAFAAGDLMFYTDGHWIYDRTHTKMNLDTGAVHKGDANVGTVGDDGKTFPAQGAVIIPNAAGGVVGNVWKQYYVIQNSCHNGPIKWSIVDMTLNSGKGEVLSASANTTLVANAAEMMCVNTTTGIGSGAYWHFFFIPPMANSADDNNQHVKAIKFDNSGIGTPFIAVDMPSNRWDSSNITFSGEMVVNQTNDIIAIRTNGSKPFNNQNWVVHVWGLNPTTALSGTATTGLINNDGWNAGAQNGTYSWILGGSYQEQNVTFGGYTGFLGMDKPRTLAFSAGGDYMYMAYANYYDPADPFNLPLVQSGWGLQVMKIKAYADELMLTGGWVMPSSTSDGNTFDTDPNKWTFYFPIVGASPNTTLSQKTFPDASTPSGWLGTPPDETRCNVAITDMTIGPDNNLWLSMVEWTQDDIYTLSIGQGQQVTNSLLRLSNPTSGVSIEDQLTFVTPVGSFDIGNRRMGERFPVWLNMPCPCDPANVINPDPTITATHTDCTDCAPPPNFCYKLTECECTGGTSGYNQCAVNDPATMPAPMITYGKSWSPTCTTGNVTQRWQAIVNAVQALGTTAAPGVAQTVNFSYSFINDGATFPLGGGYPGFGPAKAVEQGPGTANPTGISSACAPYNKTYTITFTQFRAEMVTMFNNIKAMFEGMFNTNCGYGANLTVNFTDLGYETGYTAGDPAMGTNTIASSNGTSFTDSNGVAGIGDFRIGFADFGAIDGPCGNTGAASSILGLCFTGDINNNNPGISKTSPYVGLLLFDANEDWRKAGDAVVANSFDLIRVGIHEILHAFGYGHDFLTFGPQAANCDCPCYQSDSTCPSMYPTPAGVIPNSDALMGPFATTASFGTVFPTGLMGPEGIYDRRATCGIYGNDDPNYACQDGVCLGSGCTYITEYSDDPALAGYVGGIITWDNGDPAGERCWTVEIENPCPAGVPLVNPVNLVSGNPTGDCDDCDPVNPCWTLDLCSCDTSMGAPAQIITTTDMSGYCDGTIGTGTVVEVDLYPGACYEINCAGPDPCPAAGTVAVVVTNTYPACVDCCSSTQTCYQLCPCTPSYDSCSSGTLISTTISGYSQNYQEYSVNTPTDNHSTKKLISASNPSNSGQCYDTVTGNAIVRLQGIRIYKCGTSPNEPLDGMTNYSWMQTQSWDTARAELVAAGYGNATMDYDTMKTWLQTNYVGSDGLNPCFAINGALCFCNSACTVVTNDLSGQLGDVVTLGGVPPAPLNTTECYEVQACGTCGTGSCNPVGAVVVNTVHPDCPDCIAGGGCLCYKLTDCSDPNIVINNVCQSAALDTAFINGDIIQINGNTQTCWEIDCDDNNMCDPGTCLAVAVTASFASCAACLGSQMWECDPMGGCNCVPSAGAGFATEAACLADPPCCPNPDSWDCDPVTGTCYDPGTGLGQYATVGACIQDCGTPESYNCIYSAATNTYSCSDPGDGSGTFATLADCTTAVSTNTQPCYVESYNCVINNGVTQCIDPGDGSGAFNNTNGGLAACAACNGCPTDPTCAGVTVTYDCDPVFGCIPNYAGTGQYPTLQDCALDCASYEPEEGTFEATCENCLDEIDMKKFFDKVADVCDDCNVPFGLTDQEVTCDTGCFGNSNIYVFLDITSTFGGTFLERLQKAVQFKVDVIEPAFAQIQTDNPTYSGHLYIIPGAWPHGSQFGPCNNCNGTGAAAPGSATAPEDWLAWVNYPMSGNAGANGAGANPMATGTLPANQRTIMGHTMVNGRGGAPFDCNVPAYEAAVHGPLLQQLMILPGSYNTDGFNQVNPWQDPIGQEGFSDPYHEFEGGDNDAIVIIFQDESRGNPGGYHENNTAVDQWGGTCGNALWGGAPGINWHSIGTGPANALQPQWKNDYNNFMSLHEFGWNTSGVANAASSSYNVTLKTMIYAGSHVDHSTTAVVQTRRDFLYHLFGAVGAQSLDADISFAGHIDCASYVGVPSMYGFDCFVATDVTIPNPYMGAAGGGDPTLTTGYLGGSLSNYNMTFHIPNYPIMDLSSTMLYDLWKEYLSDC